MKHNALKRKNNLYLWIMCIPAIVKIFLFNYVPLVGLTIAFQFFIPKRGFFHSPWVGMDNFDYLFKSSIASRLMTNAIILNVCLIFFGLLFSVLFGLFLFDITNKVFVRVSQVILTFPHFITWPLAGILLTSFIGKNGMIARGMLDGAIDFYAHPEYWRFIIVFMNVWKTAGFAAISYYAFLTSNDRAVYEAAAIDGASRFQRMWHISLPSLKLLLVVNVIMQSANLLRSNFSLIYFLTNNSTALYPTMDVIETYMFRAMREDGNYSVGTAIGLFQGFVGLIMTLITNWISNKVAQSSLF